MKTAHPPSPHSLEDRLDEVKTRGDRLRRGEGFEKTAFGLCKIALFCLLTGPYALPFAALGASAFFFIAVWHGKRDTKCWAKNPIAIAVFWLGVAGVWAFLHWK